MPCYAPNKHNYTKAEIAFIKSYYSKIPNTDILKQVNTMRLCPVNMSALRHQMRRMKLIKGVRLIHWTAEQTAFLVANYETVGNIEIAKKLNKMKLSARKFDKKHVEKKMNLLGIKRTDESLLFIKENHKKAGRYPGRVFAQPEGFVNIRIMNGIPHPHVKKGSFFIKKAREVYKDNIGVIPAGHMVHFKDLDTLNLSPSNLFVKKVGDLTFAEKTKMLQIGKANIERLNRPAVKEIEYVRPDIAKADQKIKVEINARLTLYVKPGTDINVLRAKYNRPLNQGITPLGVNFKS